MIEKFKENFCQLETSPGGDTFHIIAYNERNPEKYYRFIINTIEEAYKSGREEVLNNLHGFVCDMAISKQSKSLKKEDCLELIRYQIERIYGKKLQSLKEK